MTYYDPNAPGGPPPPPPPPAAPWQQPHPGPGAPWQQPPPQIGSGLHVAALVCGIVGALLGFIPLFFFIALPLGVVALVLGVMAYRRAKRVGVKQGRAGMILGSLAIVLGVLGIAIVGDAFEDLDDDLSCIDEADTVAEIDACNEEG